MLAHETLKAFIRATQADKSKIFYKDILELTLVSEDEYALEFDANGTALRIILVQKLIPQAFTVLGWNVRDIFSTIRSLHEENIFCEKYDFLEQDALGVWTAPGGAKVAWFKDPDGNVLSLTQ